MRGRRRVTVEVSAKQLFKQFAISVGVSAALAGTAMATPVGSFEFTQEFEFVDPTQPGSIIAEGITSGVSNIAGNTKLSWGTEANSEDKISSLVINPEAGDSESPSGDLTTGSISVAYGPDAINNLVFADGPTLVHNNFVIKGASLQSATAQDYIRLFNPLPDDGQGTQVQEVTFDVDFAETKNNAPDGTGCTHVKVNASGCGDIFAIDGGLLGAGTLVNNGAQLAFLLDSFVRAGYAYDVYIAAVGLEELNEASCALAGADAGCIGFTTFENESNEFLIEFAILARQVPVPATLLLFGGSLLSMAWFRRRKAVA